MSILPSISDLPTGKNLVSGLFGEIVKMVRRPDKDKKDSSQKFLLVGMALLALMLVFLTEPLKVVFRKRIGSNALDVGGVIVGCGVYLGWGILGLGVGLYLIGYSIMDSSYLPMSMVYGMYAYRFVVLIISLAYLALPFYILNIAMHEHFRAKAEDSEDIKVLNYRGDSILMEKYRKKGWSKNRIWYVAEPMTALIWGIVLVFIHPLFGLPLLLSAIAFGVNEWYHCRYIPESQKSQLKEMRIKEQMMKSYEGDTSTQDEKFYVR